MDLRRWTHTMIAWCPRLNKPATECNLDGCTHYMIDAPLEDDES